MTTTLERSHFVYEWWSFPSHYIKPRHRPVRGNNNDFSHAVDEAKKTRAALDAALELYYKNNPFDRDPCTPLANAKVYMAVARTLQADAYKKLACMHASRMAAGFICMRNAQTADEPDPDSAAKCDPGDEGCGHIDEHIFAFEIPPGWPFGYEDK